MYCTLYLIVSMFILTFVDGKSDRLTAGPFNITGKIEMISAKDKTWMSDIRILVEGGKYRGYIRPSGHFIVNNVPSGSYVVEVVHPNLDFKPARVDILSSGKMRAREVYFTDPNKVRHLPYPLMFNEWRKPKYFEKREEMGIQEVVTNPMVLQMVTMVLPVILLLYVQQMMPTQDAEAQQQMTKQMKDLTGSLGVSFDISEWLTNFFSAKRKKNKNTALIKSDRSAKIKPQETIKEFPSSDEELQGIADVERAVELQVMNEGNLIARQQATRKGTAKNRPKNKIKRRK